MPRATCTIADGWMHLSVEGDGDLAPLLDKLATTASVLAIQSGLDNGYAPEDGGQVVLTEPTEGETKPAAERSYTAGQIAGAMERHGFSQGHARGLLWTLENTDEAGPR